jgi:hypothetical protein
LHLWAGPHVFEQLGKASKGVSLVTAWRPVVNLLSAVMPLDEARTLVSAGSALTVVALAWALSCLVRSAPSTEHTSAPGQVPNPDEISAAKQTRSAMTAAFVLATAYALGAPYALPWYDTLTWALLPLMLGTALDGILLARLTVMAMAYVPGRVVAMSSEVQSLTLGFRKIVGPLAAWLVWLAVTGLVRHERSRLPPGPGSLKASRPQTS